jgi:hypothetical protein
MSQRAVERPSVGQILLRKDVLTGLLFMGFAAFGLWLSRDYPIGTAVRMGTGYIPRLLCWVLLGLGALIALQGALSKTRETDLQVSIAGAWQPLVFVTGALIVFALTLERLGLVVAIALLCGVGAVAARTLKPVETIVAAIVLIVLSWAIFIIGLGLAIPVWPEF